jgi:hypothetical protein
MPAYSSYVWNSRRMRLRTAYDTLRRPVGLFVLGADPATRRTRKHRGRFAAIPGEQCGWGAELDPGAGVDGAGHRLR